MSPNAGWEGRSCGVSANEYSCAHHVTWSPNKLWRSTSIFYLYEWDSPFRSPGKTAGMPPIGRGSRCGCQLVSTGPWLIYTVHGTPRLAQAFLIQLSLKKESHELLLRSLSMISVVFKKPFKVTATNTQAVPGWRISTLPYNQFIHDKTFPDFSYWQHPFHFWPFTRLRNNFISKNRITLFEKIFARPCCPSADLVLFSLMTLYSSIRQYIFGNAVKRKMKANYNLLV